MDVETGLIPRSSNLIVQKFSSQPSLPSAPAYQQAGSPSGDCDVI